MRTSGLNNGYVSCHGNYFNTGLRPEDAYSCRIPEKNVVYGPRNGVLSKLNFEQVNFVLLSLNKYVTHFPKWVKR